MPLSEMPPSFSSGYMHSYSLPKPKQLEAVMTGFLNETPAMFTFRLVIEYHPFRLKYRAVLADMQIGHRAVVPANRRRAAQARAHAAGHPLLQRDLAAHIVLRAHLGHKFEHHFRPASVDDVRFFFFQAYL